MNLTKTIVIMKLTVILLLAVMLQVQAKSYSQSISLHTENKPIEKVFEEIRKQSSYYFLFTDAVLGKANPVTVKCRNMPLDKVLSLIFQDQPLTYSIVDRTIVVVVKETPREIPAINLPPIRIKGRVLDSKGYPLPGATITIKGHNGSAQANTNGEFELEIPNDKVVLEISFVGFTTQLLSVNGKREIDIKLELASSQLNDVVVIGYGTARKQDLTGSVLSLSAKDLNKGLNTSVDQMIQGRAPGVQVTQSSSEPGGAVSIRIRGASSINAGNEPLYVIDGLPIDNAAPVTSFGAGAANFTGGQPARNPLSSLNPSDIESINILKDASATAIYGSRGANGVVLITTKSGKAGKSRIQYNTSISNSTIARKMEVMNTSQYIKVMNELAVARGGTEIFDQEDITAFGAGTDWQDAILQTGSAQTHDLSISGGSEATQIYTSLNYTKQNGIVKNSGFERYQARSNIKHKVSDRFRIGMNLNVAVLKNVYVPVNGFFINQDADVINTALNAPPIFPIRNADGSYFKPELAQTASVTLDNPVAMVNGQLSQEETNRFFGNFFAEYDIVKGLSAKINIGGDRNSSRRDTYNSRATTIGNAGGGIATVTTGELKNMLAEFTLNYKKTVAEYHDLNVIAGYTYQEFQSRSTYSSTRGFAADVIGTNNLGLGVPSLMVVGSGRNDRKLLSYLARVNYAYKDKYLATASLRADGSSNFGANNRFGIFPSFSLAWKINEENFLQSADWLPAMKLRIGWGQIGNDNIGAGRSLTTYASSGNGAVFGNTVYTSISATRIPNPDLKWETSEQFNAGIDMELFQHRLNLSVDYYVKRSKDLLQELPIPSATGYNVITSNVGEIRNSGFEFLLNSRNLTGALRWNSMLNFTTLNNKVINLGPIPEIIANGGGATGLAIVRPGWPLYSYYGYKANGIFQTQEEIDKSPLRSTAKPGDPNWADTNADGKIDASDRVLLGNPFPKFTLGFNNEFEYKNINLSFFIEAVQGVDLLSWSLVDAYFSNDPYRNRLAEPMLNRWTPDNPTNSWPSAINPSNYQASNINSFTVTDASFVRLKNVQLGYRIPLPQQKIIKDAFLYLSGQNLLLITDYIGYDPDVNATGSSNVRLDRNAYPAARTFTLGLNLGF
jgi:TonB-linked SusC/RagA family outer membrane protein